MKKFLLSVSLVLLVAACGGKREHVNYEGNPLAADTFPGRIFAIECDPSSGNLALALTDSMVVVYEPVTGKHLREIRKHIHIINDVAYSPDSRLLAVAGADEVLTVHQAGTGELIDSVVFFNGPVTSVAFSSDARFLAAGFGSGAVEVWDAQARERFGEFEGHQGVVTAVEFRPGTRELYTAGRDSLFYIADVEDTVSFMTRQSYGYINCVAFSRDGEYFATGGTDKLVKLWRWKGEELRSIGWYQSDLGKILDLVFLPDGSHIFTTDQEGYVTLLNRTELEDTTASGLERGGAFRLGVVEMGRFKAHQGPLRACELSLDGSKLYTGGDDRVLKVWDVAEIVSQLEGKAPPEEE